MATQSSNGNNNDSGEPKHTLVQGQTSQGAELNATLLRVNRHAAVFEVYDPTLALRTSEVLSDFKILMHGGTLYFGRAVVRSLVNAGTAVVAEVTLSEGGWRDISANGHHKGSLAEDFVAFQQEQQKLYKIRPAFKLAVADMQSFLADLRLWCEQVELDARSQPSRSNNDVEREAVEQLIGPVSFTLAAHFERFEEVAKDIEFDLRPAHNVYAKRQLHPLVLCAPFMYRTFQKPLGYAGDYEMVNMMMRDSVQGGSTFAKILNTFFLNTPPVVAHRNRVDYLLGVLNREILRRRMAGGEARIFITASCHAWPPENAARLCQRWITVHTPSGMKARPEPRRLRKKAARASAGDSGASESGSEAVRSVTRQLLENSVPFDKLGDPVSLPTERTTHPPKDSSTRTPRGARADFGAFFGRAGSVRAPPVMDPRLSSRLSRALLVVAVLLAPMAGRAQSIDDADIVDPLPRDIASRRRAKDADLLRDDLDRRTQALRDELNRAPMNPTVRTRMLRRLDRVQGRFHLAIERFGKNGVVSPRLAGFLKRRLRMLGRWVDRRVEQAVQLHPPSPPVPEAPPAEPPAPG